MYNLYLCNINQISNLPTGTIKLFIARQPIKDMDKYNLHHVLSLSPSYNLLIDYKSNKIGWYDYVYRFRKEMVENNRMKPTLDKIYKTLATKDVALICYCKNSNLCHRGLIGNYFNELGINVKRL